MNFTPTPSTSTHGAASFQRQFVSAQSRYDNVRVRENEMHHRLCRECGRIVHGDDLNFQHHIISHEAAFICYQIYHFEKGTTLPKNYYGQSRAKFTKDKVTEPSSSAFKKLARDFNRRHVKQSQPKKRPADSLPRAPKPKKDKKSRGPGFINDRPERKNELNLSEDESNASHITDSDDDGIVLPVDDDYEEKNAIGEQDPEGIDYVPTQSTSSRGRNIKPKSVVE